MVRNYSTTIIIALFLSISFVFETAFGQEVYLLKDPMHAAAARIASVDQAKELVQLDYYIFSEDLAGYATLAKVIEAARRKREIEIAIDGYPPAPGESLTEAALAYLLQVKSKEKLPITIKKYNPWTRWRPISSVRRRSHDKVFIVDREIVIVGDKNIGNPYFEIPGKVYHRNFGATTTEVEQFGGLDVLVKGKNVKSILDASRYFTQKFQKSFMEEPVLKKVDPEAVKEVERRVQLAATLTRRFFSQNPHYLTEWRQNPIVVDRSEFVHDPIEIKRDMIKQRARTTAKELYKLLREAKPGDTVQIYTPYLITTPEMDEAIDHALKQKAKVQFFSNPTEFVFEGGGQELTAIMTPYEYRKLIERGAEVYVFADESGRAMHDKAILVKHGESTAVEGSRPVKTSINTFNWDPRSQDKNTEIGFVFEGRELSEQLGRMLAADPYEQVHFDQVAHVEPPMVVFKRELKKTKWGCLLGCLVREAGALMGRDMGRSGSKSCEAALTWGKAILFRSDL